MTDRWAPDGPGGLVFGDVDSPDHAEADARTEERERAALCAIPDGEAVPRWT